MEQSTLELDSLLPKEADKAESLGADSAPPVQEAKPSDVAEAPPAVEAKPAEQVAAPEPMPAVEEKAPEVVVAPEPIAYADLDAVVAAYPKMDAGIRAHIEPIMAIVRNHAEEYGEAKKRYDDLITELTDLGFDDAAQTAAKLEEYTGQIDVLANDVSSIAWTAFRRLHPEFETAPDNVKQAFAALAENSLSVKFAEEPNYLAKLEAAFEFVQFKHGKVPMPATKAEPVAQAVAAVAPPKAANPHGRRQAVVADGSQAWNRPRVSVDDRSMDEILAQHEHLLTE